MDPTPASVGRRSLGLYVAGFIVVAAAIVGTLQHVRSGTVALGVARAAMEAEAARGPRVTVATVVQGPKTRTLQLLGDARPYLSTTLFAKVSGYLKSVPVDKGDIVTAGQVVAEIDSSELDSQYEGAVADLYYKERMVVRARELLRTGNTPQQTADQAEANFRMAQETVRNLDTMRSYQILRAPFAGTVTARFADPGALMQAATTNQASSLPVLQIADTSRLRIGVYVEQADVAGVHIGDAVEVIDAANAERRRTARVSRTAGTLDPRTRTLLVEIDVDNKDGFIVAGSFIYVTLQVPLRSLPQVPGAAIVQRGGAAQVAIVGPDATVHLRPVRVASTDGIVVSLAEGVTPGETVAVNLPNDVTDGAKIRPATQP
jgi:membrane fusion protein (multidrug efflux system)